MCPAAIRLGPQAQHGVPALEAVLRPVAALQASCAPPASDGRPTEARGCVVPWPRALAPGQPTPSYPNGSETVVIAPFSTSVISATALSPRAFGVTLTACAPGWAVSAAVTAARRAFVALAIAARWAEAAV